VSQNKTESKVGCIFLKETTGNQLLLSEDGYVLEIEKNFPERHVLFW
jgi:hypothetical protein